MALSLPEGRVVLSSQLAEENKDQDCDIYSHHTSRPLEVIQQEIQDYISRFGFLSFRYSSVPVSLIEGTIDTQQSLFDLKQRSAGREGFGTLPVRTLKSYYQTLAEQDSLWGSLNYNSHEPLIHPEPDSSPSLITEFLRREGINSMLALPMHWQTGDGWFCLFTLQSRLTPEQLTDHYQEIREQLHAHTLAWHLELMTHKQDKFNPYIVHKILSPRARHILSLAALGHSSRTIAKMTEISDNGVNYHYREAKRVLGAKNRTHLVSLAKDQRII